MIEAIERCKQVIRYRAAWTGVRFLENDIMVTNEDDYVVVALRRAFLGYKEDENGALVLDDDFEPIPLFRNLMWLEYSENSMRLDVDQEGNAMIEMVTPKLAVLTPWLVFVVAKDNNPCDVIDDTAPFDF